MNRSISLDVDGYSGRPKKHVGYYVAKMWSPTHVQVTVQRARGLIPKNNHGVFVTIGLGKDKYQTSVKDRNGGESNGSGGGGGGGGSNNSEIEWHEKCELKIPSHGNTASIVLTVLSQTLLGIDNFLGCVNIPLAELDVYDRPKNKWYELQDRQGKPKHKERGELEVKIGFSVRPGSLNDVSKKDGRRGSLGQLSQVAHNVGGSLASISSVDKKSFKKLAKTITKKIKKEKKLQEEDTTTTTTGVIGASVGTLRTSRVDSSPGISKKSASHMLGVSRQVTGDADPGVISDDDEFAFDDLSHTGSGCSLEVTHPSHHSNSATGSVETVAISTDASTTTGGLGGSITGSPLAASSANLPAISSSSMGLLSSASASAAGIVGNSPSSASHQEYGANKFNTLPSSKPSRSTIPIQEKFAHKWEQRLLEAKRSKMLNKSSERIVVGGEAKSVSPVLSRLSPEIARQYENKSREDLIEIVQRLQNSLNKAHKERKDLEDYIDNLLLRVMEHSPSILQNPYAT